MKVEDYRRHDAVGLAALISRGEVGAAQVLEAAIAVAEAADPELGDGGGSIRVPRARCGLFSLKPGRGRTLAGPGHAELMFGASVNGVVLGPVRDTAAFLDVITGFEQAVRSWRSHRSGRTATRSAETRAGRASASRPTRHSARRSIGRRCRPAQCGGPYSTNSATTSWTPSRRSTATASYAASLRWCCICALWSTRRRPVRLR